MDGWMDTLTLFVRVCPAIRCTMNFMCPVLRCSVYFTLVAYPHPHIHVITPVSQTDRQTDIPAQSVILHACGSAAVDACGW
mmetsp:Transcript_25044/g.72308  ORF Transcript_25044/g.72308 Transcript_25044/m.72308 type:complete len:81 (-) Transcript_25044:525-767(-)